MAEVTALTQGSQWGIESVHGTAVAANKLLEAISVSPAIEADFDEFTKEGNRFATQDLLTMEWSSWKLAGKQSYTEMVYPFSTAWGAAAITTVGTTGRLWTWTPSLKQLIDPKTASIESGDAVRARKAAYAFMHGLSLKSTLKAADISGDMLAQVLNDAGSVTMTASPTPVGHVPIKGSHYSVFLDSTSAGLGTTKLLRLFSIDFAPTNLYGPVWTMDRANASFAAHADLKPSYILKLRVENDAQSAAIHATLQAGSLVYIRIEAVSPTLVESAVPYKHTIDGVYAVKKPSAAQDQDGIYAYDWEFRLVEDVTWGKAAVISLQNGLTAL